MTASHLSTCADCGTRGNVCRDSDGVDRCSFCSKAAYDARHRILTAAEIAECEANRRSFSAFFSALAAMASRRSLSSFWRS